VGPGLQPCDPREDVLPRHGPRNPPLGAHRHALAGRAGRIRSLPHQAGAQESAPGSGEITPVTPAATPTPSPAPSSPPAPPQQQQQTPDISHDVDDVHLFDDDTDGGDGADDDGSEGAPAEIEPIGPPPEATPEEQSAWLKAHGIPEDAAGYQPPQVEGLQWNAEAISPIAEIAREHHIPQPAFEAALAAYAEQVQATQARMKAADAERQKAVRSQMTRDERNAIEAFAKGLDRDTRQALKSARTADGSLLIHRPDFLRMLTGLGTPSKATNAKNDELRLSEIDRARRQDVGQYFKNGMAEETTAILNRKAQRDAASAEGPRPDDAKREAEIRKVMRADMSEYFARPELGRELSEILARRGEA
jgi:hypothetical protein